MTQKQLKGFPGAAAVTANDLIYMSQNGIEVAATPAQLAAGIAQNATREVFTAGPLFTASISGTVMTVSAVASGTLAVGQTVFGAGVAGSPAILPGGTGTGGTGTYNLSVSQSTIASESMGAASSSQFAPGFSTSITLAGTYGSINNISVLFDAAPQTDDTLNGQVLGFNPTVPLGTQQIVVIGWPARSIGAPADASVTDVKVALGSKLYNRINDTISVKDNGASGNGSTDQTAACVASIQAGRTTYFPAGSYVLSGTSGNAALTFDYSGITAEPIATPTGPRFKGDGPRQSILYATTPGMYAVKVKGGTGFAANIYNTFEGMAITSGSLGSSVNGMWMFDCAFASVRDMLFEYLNTGLLLESTLSSEFESLIFNSNAIGTAAHIGAGFSYPNVLKFISCRWRNNTTWGYSGDGAHTNISFIGGSFEENGTQGNSNTGGIILNFDGTQGGVGANFDGVYFEGNAGNADVVLINNGSIYVTHTFNGCNFNRISSSAYVTNNVHSTGKNILVFVGCSFNGYGSYVEDVSRLYVNGDANTIIICIGCTFGSSVAQGTLRNIDHSAPFAGYVNAAASTSTLPNGWTVSHTASTGIYTVTHNMNLGVNAYSVVANANDSNVGRVQRTANLGANSFQVVTVTDAGAAGDFGFNFLLSII